MLVVRLGSSTGPPATAPTAAVAADLPAPEPHQRQVRTGETFWGLHLDGVIPCSTLMVKGGGHLVILAPVAAPAFKCYFHVKDGKQVELEGQCFTLEVVGDDQIAVARAVDDILAAAVP